MGGTTTSSAAVKAYTNFQFNFSISPLFISKMSQQMISSLCLLFCIVLTANACSNPTLSSTSFTTQDATILTNIAYVSQFKLECDGEVAGKPLSVVKSKETNNYQVSWVEETQKASRGNFEIKIYTDEGYAAVRKAQRSGEDTLSIAPLGVVILNHPGAYNGPWINSEYAAAILAGAVLYYAYVTKSKLVA